MSDFDPLRDRCRELVARIIAGDETAEHEFASDFRRPIYAIAIVRTRNRAAAQDITQNVLMAALGALRAGKIREPEKLPAFVHSITKNLVNNHFRARGRLAETSVDEAKTLYWNPGNEFEVAEKRRLVREEIAACSPIDQKILLFSIVDELSLADIAERLKLSHEAVRARKSRLIRKLAKKFEKLSQKPPDQPLD